MKFSPGNTCLNWTIAAIVVSVFIVSPSFPVTCQPMTKEDKVLAANAAGIGFIMAWGIVNWDYFDNTMHSTSEGWFGENTKSGGADKLGHFHSSYTLSHLLGATYNKWGYPPRQSAMLGSTSSFILMGCMEVGDSFSSYGFSGEDFIMNSLGCITGYYMAVTPELAKRLAFRTEYLPSFDTTDILTDYDNQKYFMALKLSGFESIRNRLLKFLEFKVGYYTRDFPDPETRSRHLFVGLGVNMSEVFNRFEMRKSAVVTEYYQVPYTYMGVEYKPDQ